MELGTQRDAPPHFAGRSVELAALNRRLDALCVSASAEAGISLVTGVQGVGKTHLGLKFARDATKREGARRVFWKSMLPDTLAADDAVVFMAIMRALGSESIGRKVADLDAKATAVGGGLGIAKANVSLERVRKTHDLAELLSDSVAAGAWNGKALVVTIDELQTVSSAGMGALRVLHQGVPDCPLMVLGIGLQHTPEVLSNPQGTAGISRVAEEFNLGPLSAADTFEAIYDGLLALGHDVPEPCAKKLAEASMGFPQHVHGYLAGACEAISRHGRLAKGVPLTEAIAIGDKARVGVLRGTLAAHVQQPRHAGGHRRDGPARQRRPGHRHRDQGARRRLVRRCQRRARGHRTRRPHQKRPLGTVLRHSVFPRLHGGLAAGRAKVKNCRPTRENVPVYTSCSSVHYLIEF